MPTTLRLLVLAIGWCAPLGVAFVNARAGLAQAMASPPSNAACEQHGTPGGHRAPGRVPDARAAIAQAMNDPRFVTIDRPMAGGPWCAAGRHYRASFGDGRWRFVGRPAPGAPSLQSVELQLANASVAGVPLEFTPASPQRDDCRIAYAHGPVVETIDVGPNGVEQTFTFAALQKRGEIVVEISIATELTATTTAAGVEFAGPFDRISYSAAVAIDAAGERVAAPTAHRDGRIAIRVPAAFVERAALPLRIDPLVTSTYAVAQAVDVVDPDVTWDEPTLSWTVVFTTPFGVQHDCFVQRVSDTVPMALIGTPIAIDNSVLFDWRYPRIASLPGYGLFMVVAQTQLVISVPRGPYLVFGRQFTNTGTATTNIINLQSSAVDNYHPDIAGDVGPGPGYFTVVWERATTSTNHDIIARQVDWNGALVGAAEIIVQGNTLNQTRPSIAKSAGGGSLASRRLTIAWQQTRTTFPFDENIHGALLTWDGQPVQVGFGTTFAIDTSTNNDLLPQPSSPALPDANGQRPILVVYERTNVNNGDIAATCIDQAGNVLAADDITVLEANAATVPWPQAKPSVDCDGVRFVVAYQHDSGPSGTLDTLVALVARAGGSLLVEEPTVTLGPFTDPEFDTQVATRYSGSGTAHPGACIVNDLDTVFGAYAIAAYRYDAAPTGRFVTRATGCAGPAITHSGVAALGNAASFQVAAAPNLPVFSVGLPTAAPIGPCPGCQLGVANGSLLLGPTYTLTVPNDPIYIGFTFAVQGFGIGPTALCIGTLAVGDTIDVTVH